MPPMNSGRDYSTDEDTFTVSMHTSPKHYLNGLEHDGHQTVCEGRGALLPGEQTLRHVHPRPGTPVAQVVFCCFLQYILQLKQKLVHASDYKSIGPFLGKRFQGFSTTQ
jgi:hypothetical protein